LHALFWLRAKTTAGGDTDVEKAATRLTVNSADANEAGRRKRATIVGLDISLILEKTIGISSEFSGKGFSTFLQIII
jgi:hypothetical protein